MCLFRCAHLGKLVDFQYRRSKMSWPNLKLYLYLFLQTKLCSGQSWSWALVWGLLDWGDQDWRHSIGLQQTLHKVSVNQGELDLVLNIIDIMAFRLIQTLGISTRTDCRWPFFARSDSMTSIIPFYMYFVKCQICKYLYKGCDIVDVKVIDEISKHSGHALHCAEWWVTRLFLGCTTVLPRVDRCPLVIRCCSCFCFNCNGWCCV